MRAISSPWNKQSIQRSLNTVFTGKSLEVVPITTSTLDDAHQAIAHGAPHGHAILADYQTKGRGRSNHTWFSPPHTNIYLSIVLKHGPYPGLTLHAGLACARALQTFVSNPIWIKWPNDLFFKGSTEQKAGGILVESKERKQKTAAIGIGININQDRFPKELNATSLYLQEGKPINRKLVLIKLLEELEQHIQESKHHGMKYIIQPLKERLLWKDEWIQCGDLCGRIRDIDASGALILETKQGQQKIISGTIKRL